MSYNQPPPPGGYGNDGGYGGQPPYGGQPGYGGQPYGGEPQQTSVMAIIGLVTGIIGVIPCFWGCFVFSIAAGVLGFLGKKEVAEGKKKGGGMALAALILGGIGFALGILYWILFAAGAFEFDYYSDF